MRRRMTAQSAALRAVIFAASILAMLMLSGAVRPVELLSPAQTGQGSAIILEDFGPEGIRAEDPFDGQYIYVTARLLPDLDAITEHIYESDYRLVRILHPLLASPARAGPETIYALQLWNLVGVGLFVWALADLLRRYGFDPQWAIAGAAACLLSLIATTSEPLAFGFGLAGVAFADRNRLLAATLFLALGGLTRESALTFALAAAVLLLMRRRRAAAVATFVGAVVPTALWWAYVQSITEHSRVPVAPLGILHLPDQSVSNIVISLVALGLIGIAIVMWWDVPPLRWVAITFAAWIPIYESFAFRIVGLPRLSLPSIALGIAGILRWRDRQRTPAPAARVIEEPARLDYHRRAADERGQLRGIRRSLSGMLGSPEL